MSKAICEDCGSLVEAELTHNGICAIGHYVHCGWGHQLSPNDLISDDVAQIISELESKLALMIFERDEVMMFERDEAWKRAAHSEKMWGEAEAKLAKAVEALNIVDLSIMNNTGGIEWLLWGEETVSDIRTVMAELGEK